MGMVLQQARELLPPALYHSLPQSMQLVTSESLAPFVFTRFHNYHLMADKIYLFIWFWNIQVKLDRLSFDSNIVGGIHKKLLNS